MAWMKFHADTMDDPKLLKVSAEARWLWVVGRCYITEHLTDGVIPRREVFRAANLRRPAEAANALVDEELWERYDDGFYDPTWRTSIRSRDEVQAERQKIKKKVSEWRK